MSRKKLILLAAALVVVIAAFIGIYAAFSPKPVQGAKAIVVEVVDDKGETTTYEHRTDQEFLRGAMEEIEGLTIEGDESEFGLYIKVVNGVRAVYETDGAYWSLYVNGEYGMNGVDTQPVVDGDTYALKYEKAA